MKAVKNIFITMAAVFALFALASCQNPASDTSSVEDVFAGTTWEGSGSSLLEFASSGNKGSIYTVVASTSSKTKLADYDYSVTESDGAYTATATVNGVTAFTFTIESKDATTAKYSVSVGTTSVTYTKKQ